MPLSEYMSVCLTDPAHGYYATRDPFGSAGDFTTAPEISQMFGELLGLALAQSWTDQGSPAPFTLAEAGPGRGTLMADILRATARVPGFHDALRLHLVETSPTLRDRQRQALDGYRITFLDDVADLPQAPLWFVANEFFDALPIRQLRRRGSGWAEVMVALSDTGLKLALAPPADIPELAHRLADTAEDDIVEICPALPAIMHQLADRISRSGGAALIVDYGDWRSLGDTFQAIRAQEYVDPLTAPGDTDLTAHVDFEALARAAAPLAAAPPLPQGQFLERLGIAIRAETLATRLSGQALNDHIAAYRRLTHPDEMGTLFKVIAMTPPDAPSFPGTGSPQFPQ
ncbi:class I SAM-dependent methyltransferase [Pseudooceanicola sp. C21-150M6]|uniref:class I SAM-dependent methyltransferase n=1 Tax=Pseudooceanicola sp. C21-150M6 TaxID=3434355 RepID=UPI003D7F5100